MPRPALAVALGRAGLDLASGTASEGQGLLELWQGREGQRLGVANGFTGHNCVAWNQFSPSCKSPFLLYIVKTSVLLCCSYGVIKSSILRVINQKGRYRVSKPCYIFHRPGTLMDGSLMELFIGLLTSNFSKPLDNYDLGG